MKRIITQMTSSPSDLGAPFQSQPCSCKSPFVQARSHVRMPLRITMRLALLAMLFALQLTPQLAHNSDPSSQFGVAVQNAGAVCFSIHDSHLQAGDIVTLVVPSQPQSVVEAEIAGAAESGCPGAKDSDLSAYQLKIIKGTVPNFMPLIAIAGKSAKFRLNHRSVYANYKGKRNSFRTCTSADGVHLTVWEGKPLEGTRLWHQYYYLGQDLEPDCTSKDTTK